MRLHIGDTVFPTKGAARAAIQSVLYRYGIGTTVAADDAAFLADVLNRHPERDAKIGVGVASFQVEQNLGSRGFWLTRTDGTRTDWSFLSCLTPPTPVQEAKAAFRTEIRDQIRAFRAHAFSGSAPRCPITGDVLTANDTAHVDHDPPFDVLLDGFLRSQHVDLSQISVEPTCDEETDTRLTDRQLARDWSTYHHAHARLRVVSRVANLSLLRRGVSA